MASYRHGIRPAKGELDENRKADRIKMGNILTALAIEAGAEATVGPCSYDPKRIDVKIDCPGGAVVGIQFDGGEFNTQLNVHVYCWNIDHHSDSRFSDAWGYDVVNPFHHAKAGRVAYGFADLCTKIVHDIELCVSGRAYSEERKAAHIAKNGTAAERNARWDQWRAEEDTKRKEA